ncbi:MAG: GntR family transcriptional regulator [Oscillospiraceae bacterium]
MNVIISNSSGEPLYQQISNQIKEDVLKGNLRENEMLPSIRALAKDLKISVITTKKAYDELEKSGFIFTVHGKGSYVSSKNTELLNESRLKNVEDLLSVAVKAAKSMGVKQYEVEEILKLLYEE